MNPARSKFRSAHPRTSRRDYDGGGGNDSDFTIRAAVFCAELRTRYGLIVMGPVGPAARPNALAAPYSEGNRIVWDGAVHDFYGAPALLSCTLPDTLADLRVWRLPPPREGKRCSCVVVKSFASYTFTIALPPLSRTQGVTMSNGVRYAPKYYG